MGAGHVEAPCSPGGLQAVGERVEVGEDRGLVAALGLADVVRHERVQRAVAIALELALDEVGARPAAQGRSVTRTTPPTRWP